MRIDGKEKLLIRWLLSQTGYASQNEPIIHFGLGNNATIIDEIQIHWPSGNINTIYDIEPNQLMVIEEKE